METLSRWYNGGKVAQMKRFRYTPMGAAALAYVKEQLDDGIALSRELRALSLDQWTLFSYLPIDVNVGDLDLYSIRDGFGKTVSFSGNMRVALFYILFQVQLIGESCIVFEAALWKGAPALETKTTPYFIVDSEVHHYGDVYYYAKDDQASTDLVSDVMGWARRYPHVGALIEGTPAFLTEEYGEIGDDEVRQLAAKATHIFVGAFDDEGMLILEKP